MWHDNDTLDDYIDFEYLESIAVDIIKDGSLLPCTIGLFGDWGSGKSSLMRMIEEDFSKDNETLTIKFNGWLFEGFEDAKTVLMGNILETIADKATLDEKAIKLLKKLLKKVNWMKVVGATLKYGVSALTLGPAGIALAAGTDFIGDAQKIKPEEYLKEAKEEDDSLRMGIRDFHRDFDELLKTTKFKKLVVFIDDLDRCNPDTIIATLEAIKLFLFVDSTAFVISADERLIKYAVRRRFPEIPGDAAEIGRDYLEKLIQFPVRIPPLSSNEIETYINLLFSSKHLDIANFDKIRTMVFEKNRASFDGGSFDYEEAKRILIDPHDELEGWLHLSRQITPILTIGLSGNPRQCKRFLNMLLMRIKMAKSRGIDLKQRVMAKLMLLEYFKGESFRLLSETQARENGKPGVLKVFEQNNSGKVESDDTEEESSHLPKEFEVWLNDPWLKNWLKSEPILASEDLRPYFYFSRDKLNPLNIVSQRLTPKAQTTLDKLLNKSEAIVNIGIGEFETLGPADMSGIFEVVGEKAKHEEESEGSLKLLSRLCSKRTELTSQLIIILNSISPAAIKPAIIAQTKKLSELPEYKGSFDNLLTIWSKSTNGSLSKIAKNTLDKR